MKKYIIGICLLVQVSGCTVHEAAVLGAIPGRVIGMPLGMAVTAVDETFKTAGDVVKAAPRNIYVNKIETTKVIHHNRPSLPAYRIDGDMHYYKAEVLIKTRGSAQLQSMKLLESRDVSEFWR